MMNKTTNRVLSLLLIVSTLLSLSLPSFGKEGEEVTVLLPLSFSFENAMGVDLTVLVDPQLVKTAEIGQVSPPLEGSMYFANLKGDTLRIAIASATPISSSGTLLYLKLTLQRALDSEDEPFKLLSASVGEKKVFSAENRVLVSGVSEDGIYESLPTIFFNEGSAVLDGVPFANGSRVEDYGDHILTVSDSKGGVRTLRFTVNDPFYGDVNDDGRTSIGDVTALLSYIAGSQQEKERMILEGEVLARYLDLTEDGNTSISDVTALLSFIAGK